MSEHDARPGQAIENPPADVADEEPIVPQTWGQVTDSNTLQASELTRPMTFTVAKFQSQRLKNDDGKKTRKGRITFKNDKVWVFGETNKQILQQGFGVASPQDLVGKRITIARETVKFKGKDTDGIRAVGSPDIERDVQVTVRLPRKNPINRVFAVTRS